MVKRIKKKQKTNLEKRHEEDALKEETLMQKENLLSNSENINENSSNNEHSIEEINCTQEIKDKFSFIKEDINKFYTKNNAEISWLDYPYIVSDTSLPSNLNIDDDIKRELFFYNIAKENAITGLNSLKNIGEKLNRPDDYFVEMLKSDEQMMKIKKQIISEQQYIKKFEAKKQKLQNIKFAKSLKDFQNKQKSQYKRDTYDSVAKWKKHIKDNPDDYKNIDKFFNNKKSKFNPKNLAGKSVLHKSKEKRLKDENYHRKKMNKRPGKNRRINMRNKKNSKKNK